MLLCVGGWVGGFAYLLDVPLLGRGVSRVRRRDRLSGTGLSNNYTTGNATQAGSSYHHLFYMRRRVGEWVGGGD